MAHSTAPWRLGGRTCLFGFSLAIFCLATAVAALVSSPSRDQEQLAQLQSIVGQWRGVGQLQRGSTKGSWTESAEWAWRFGAGGPALVGKLSEGRYFAELVITAGDADGSYVVVGQPAKGGEPVRFAGRLDEQQQLVVESAMPSMEMPQRLSLRFVAGGDRMLVLMERRTEAGALVRLAEVGYTRQGSDFGKLAKGRECLVTGGLGTIEVSHAGKTYFVCCTGCRDYFNENPERVLAEWRKRGQ